jgi:HPt (histidine-containing phosphotransfer) domain-containing protein
VNPEILLAVIGRLLPAEDRSRGTGIEIHGDIRHPATESQPPVTEIFDFEELLERLGGDREFITDCIIRDIPNTLSQEIEKIKAAADEKDARKMGNHAHTLKGTSANISAKRLSQAALRIEHIGKQGSTDIADSLKTLEEEYGRLRAVLADMFPEIIVNRK